MYTAIDGDDVYKGLKNRFLYENDINSIYVLLALYDVENNINNIFPRYIEFTDIKRKVSNILKNRSDATNISHNISVIIHEDINRLELCFYLEGYKDGFTNYKSVNLLENEIIKTYGIGFTYDKENFKYVITDESFFKLKERIFDDLDEKLDQSNHMIKLTDKFLENIIMKKIINLDKCIEKQLKINFDLKSVDIGEVSYELNDSEIKKIENYLNGNIKKHIIGVYKQAFWTAMNDKVFNRYK